MDQKFYKCPICGQIITKINATQIPVVCCGQPMQELVAGTVEASHEKHIPCYTVANNIVTVTVGSVEHPMIAEHFIEWIWIKTTNGEKLQYLKPEMQPKAEFAIMQNEKVLAVYAYCNLHGLWKTE